MPKPLSPKSATATLAFLLTITLSLTCVAREPVKLAPSDTPPQSLGTTIEGDEIEAGKYAGKVLVVTFWASWCGPCKKELPMLEGIQRTAKESVQVVAIKGAVVDITVGPEKYWPPSL